ncbi:MAG: restriction endonuclease subunit S [Deltaproteobacteria bacterium]|nr:restriction endonuclease subunit S [Deltaproteobacteria bacterium]
MKQGWEIKKLGWVCKKITDGSHNPPKGVSSSDFMMLSSKNIFDDLIHFENPRYLNQKDFESENKRTEVKSDDVLLTIVGTIGRVAVVPKFHPKFTLQRSVAVLKIKDEILDSRFLIFSLQNILKFITDEARGVAQKGIYLNQLKDIKIPLPPLPEQQRIVAILDKAFTAIAKAKENAEKNLKNAKEVFESYLRGVFDPSTRSGQEGSDWEEKYLEECFKLKSGDNLTSKNMNLDGKYSVFGGNGIAGVHSSFNLSGSNVIIGRVGALCGNVRHITENIWLTDNAFKIVDFKYDFDHSFLTYLLNFKNLRGFARQAAQPVISNSSLKDVLLQFPKSKTEQQTIVQKLDALSAKTKKLESIYQQKINDLEELKKSILQKAFNGELKGAAL